ncbi:ras association domain-containing protein 4-like isoform X2 [Littorina saxatilis]|uniref:Uncharacterized protein n=1 Tax=Littorina saxatilis TaxID=31220 RepID=A0AAN9GMG3_9CAEN
MGSAMQRLYYGDAERKTSLGRDWHPSCLKCVECGRVLTPGQHAEHKGNPYCAPCYKANFGPALLGYGSNLASPANFAKKDNAAEYGHDYDDDVYKREIYSNSRTAAQRRQKQRRSAPPSILDHDFSRVSVGGASSASPSSSVHSTVTNSERHPSRIANSVSQPGSNSGTHPIAGHARSQSMVTTPTSVRMDSSEVNGNPRKTRSVNKARSTSVQAVNHVGHNSNGRTEMQGAVLNSLSSSALDNGVNSVNSVSSSALQPQSPPAHTRFQGVITPALQDVLEKVKSFNSHFEGKVHHQMTVDQAQNGEVIVEGPLRVYWGLSRPIRLRQCDDVPAPPIAKWRHSLWSNIKENPLKNDIAPLEKLPTLGSPMAPSPHRPRRGVDDSILISPASGGDEVVMRRRNIRKFNTVAYRNDAPTKWKRASINGHIFNYDTSVFTPVLGSSTSVTTDSSMTSPVVIATLLDKFKVENSPGEYVLSVVTENGDQTQERLLGDTDHPILERLQLGADDQCAKIFLKERRIEPAVTVPDTVQLPIMMEEEEEEETLPADVEQLMILPVAVLKGIMIKYENDERKDERVLKAKYERIRRKIRQRLEDLKTA